VTNSGTPAPPNPSRARRLKIWVTTSGLGLLLIGGLFAYYLPGVSHSLHKPFTDPPAPLSVATVVDLDKITDWRSQTGPANYLLPKPITAIGRPPSDQVADQGGWYTWAHTQGGIDETQSIIQLDVSGTSATPTVISRLSVEVTDRRPPSRATAVGPSGQGGGVIPRVIVADLDQNPPTIKWANSKPVILSVTQSDIEVIELVAQTTQCDCSWKILLDWTAGSRQGVISVGYHGQPFRTAAPANDKDGWGWYAPSWNGLDGVVTPSATPNQ
jgi:hypothetical protein